MEKINEIKRDELKKKLLIGGLIGAVSIAPSFATDLVFNPFTNKPDLVNNDILLLEQTYNNYFNTNYVEFTYTGSRLDQIDVWTNSGKTVKLFTKVLSYTGSSLTQVAITDEQTGHTLTKVFVYSGSNLSNVTKTYT